MIIKLRNQNKWQVRARTGRNFGTYTSKAKAEVRLAQIERFSKFKRFKK